MKNIKLVAFLAASKLVASSDTETITFAASNLNNGAPVVISRTQTSVKIEPPVLSRINGTLREAPVQEIREVLKAMYSVTFFKVERETSKTSGSARSSATVSYTERLPSTDYNAELEAEIANLRALGINDEALFQLCRNGMRSLTQPPAIPRSIQDAFNLHKTKDKN